MTHGMGPFRHGLLASTVCHTEETHKLLGQAALWGDWTVHAAIHAAQSAGKDWRPAAKAAQQRMVDDANRLRGRYVLHLGSVADLTRWDGIA